MEALLYLGTHYKELGDFEEAELFCTRLLNLAGPAKEVCVVFVIVIWHSYPDGSNHIRTRPTLHATNLHAA